MPKRIFTQEIHDYIASIVDGKTNEEVQNMVEDKFNITFKNKDAVKEYICRTNITRQQKASQKGKCSIFTSEQINFIIKHYKGIGNYELVKMLNKEFGTSFNKNQIKNFKQSRHLDSGLTGRFEKGKESLNKGQKMPKEVYEKCKATMFKKGNIPQNHRHVGEERINVDGYVEVKIAEPNKWMLKQRYIWEQHNGKLSKDDKIVFLDGNKLNLDINNLSVLNNTELLEMNRNKLFTQNRDMTETGTLIAKVNVMARVRKKEVSK